MPKEIPFSAAVLAELSLDGILISKNELDYKVALQMLRTLVTDESQEIAMTFFRFQDYYFLRTNLVGKLLIASEISFSRKETFSPDDVHHALIEIWKVFTCLPVEKQQEHFDQLHQLIGNFGHFPWLPRPSSSP